MSNNILNNYDVVPDYTELPKIIKLTREFAILGDYEQAIKQYKLAFQVINK